MIPYGKQKVDEEDIKRVVESLKSDFLTTGPKIDEFECRFAEFVGSNYAVAVSSGTAALHLSCLAAGLGKDDELITSPMTFVASANCALYCNATPIFVDIDENGLIDEDKIEERITDKTRIIIPIHYAGLPCNMSKIRSIAQKNNLIIIEDACHALGAEYEETKIGSCTFSDMTVFSFHPVKHITMGEGGMITTNNKDLYEKLKRLRSHGLTKERRLLEYPDEGGWHQEMIDLGYNYRITDIQCSLGISQLQKAEQFIDARRELAKRYIEAFEGNQEIDFIADLPGRKNSYHLFVIKVKDKEIRKNLFNYLRANGIGCQVHYLPVYLHPFYRKLGYKKGLCQAAERFYERIISMPLYPLLTTEEQEFVIKKVNDFFTMSKNVSKYGNMMEANKQVKTKKIIAIIPARGGSKTIPRKNIKMLGDKPLIAHPIELAKSIPSIGRVIVSTDDEEIATVAREWGAEVPFIRPAELAKDETPTLPVLQHCVKYLEEKEGFKADIILLLYPTNPFLRKEHVAEAVELLKKRDFNTVVSVVKDWGRYWALDENIGSYAVFYPKERVNRQYYKPLYKENGAIYFSKYETLIDKNMIVDDEKVGFVFMEEGELIDIDTPLDWKKVEEKIKQK